MDESLKKVNNITALIKSIGGIIVALVVGISSCAYAYQKIYENERNILNWKKDETAKFLLLQSRNDKRYKRMVDFVKSLKTMHKEDEERIIELEKNQSETKGYLKAYRELR